MADNLFKLVFGVDEAKSQANIVQGIEKIINSAEFQKHLKLKFQFDFSDLRREVRNISEELSTALGRTSTATGTGSAAGSDVAKQYASLQRSLEAMRREEEMLEQTGTKSLQTQQQQITALQRKSKVLAQIVALGKTNPELFPADGDHSLTMVEEQLRKVNEDCQRLAQKRVDIKAQVDTTKAESDLNKFNDLMRRYTAGVPSTSGAWNISNQFSSKINATYEQFQHAYASGDFDTALTKQKELNQLTEQYRHQMELAGYQVNDTGHKMSKAFGSKMYSRIAGGVLMLLTRMLRKVFTEVKNVDAALNELRIVSKASDADMQRFANTVTKSAKAIGVAVDELIRSTTVYRRLGFDLQDAAKYAELTTVYSNVSGVAVSDATTNITGIIKAYDVGSAELESVLDRLIYVGNNYAISSGEIGEAMNNAASMLEGAGNSLNESIGILTAANASIQDVSKASTGVRTIAARLSNSKAELEEMGEDTSDLASSTAKYREELLALTGVDITDAKGDLKSTYDILSALAGAWDDIEAAGNKAAVATLIAGTRQQNVFYSLMKNWNDAKSAVEGCQDATGELQKAQEVYSQSIEYRLKQLKATFTEFATSLLNSKVVQSIIRGLTNLLDSFSDKGTAVAQTIVIGLIAIWTLIMRHTKDIGQAIDSIVTKANGGIAVTKAGAVAVRTLGTALSAIPMLLVSIASFLPEEDHVAKLTLAIVALGVAAVTAIWSIIAANEALKASLWSNPITAIIMAVFAALSALVMIVKEAISINKQRLNQMSEEIKAAKEATNALKEQADALDDVADKMRDVTSEASELIDKFKEVAQVATLTEWRDTLVDIADKIKEILQDESITSVAQAVNTLLGTQYTYAELLTANDETRLALLDRIKDSLRQQGTWFGLDAYSATRKTSASMLNSYGKLSVKRNQGDDEIGWGSTAKRTVKEYNREAAAILRGINGFDVDLLDYDKQINIKTSLTNIYDLLNAYDSAIAAFENKYKDAAVRSQNAVYQAIVSARSSIQEQINIEHKALQEYSDAVITSMSSDILEAVAKLGNDSAKIRNECVEQADAIIHYIAKQTLLSIDEVSDLIGDSVKEKVDAIVNGTADYVFNGKVVLRSVRGFIADIQEAFELFGKATSEMEDHAWLSEDLLQSLEAAGLDAYIVGGKNDVQTLRSDALYQYMRDTMQKQVDIYYAAQRDYEAAKAAYDSAMENGDEAAKESAANDLLTYAQAWQDAAQNIENLKLAMSATVVTQKELNDDMIKSLEEQLGAVKDMISLRKKLLETYESEKEYRDELAEKKNTVGNLYTQLQLASLDNSEAGRAKQRQLREELASAEKELETYTLQHAIEDIKTQLDDELSAEEKIINNAVSRLQQTIVEVSTSLASVIGNVLTPSGVEDVTGDLVNTPPPTPIEVAPSSQSVSANMMTSAEFYKHSNLVKKYGTYDAYVSSNSVSGEVDATKRTEAINALVQEISSFNGKQYTSYTDAINEATGGSYTSQQLNEMNSYDFAGVQGKVSNYLHTKRKYYELGDDVIAAGFQVLGSQIKIRHNGRYYSFNIKWKVSDKDAKKEGLNASIPKGAFAISDRGTNLYFRGKGSNGYFWELDDKGADFGTSGGQRASFNTISKNDIISDLKSRTPSGVYHTGGIVADDTPLRSTEVFARLMKGELVSTPQQIANFMHSTMPEIIAATSATNNRNITINSPLLNIHCDSVTEESMPQLEQVVQEATSRIEQMLRDGLRQRGTPMPINNKKLF